MQLLTAPLTRFLFLLGICLSAQAKVSLPNIFGDHMVLQREQANPVWGIASPGEKVIVSIGGQSHTTITTADGSWRVTLEPLEVGGPYELEIRGNNTLTFSDILVGEVWVCSGQSNMQWAVRVSADAELQIASANYPEIRLLSVPQIASQEPRDDFNGSWSICDPKSVADFSAVGYSFGRRLHNTLGVPVGLIDNAWGGSAVEAWIPRDALEDADQYDELLAFWDEKTAAMTDQIFAAEVAAYKKWVTDGEQGAKRRAPRDSRTSNHRPANLYNGVLHPIIGYGIRGAIWYQGESNAGRAYQYRSLFPLMINTWRQHWQQGDFPFYWVQLADFKQEALEPRDSAWAELREAQTMALSLPNTGQAVIIDAGEGRDIHPRDKETVANRLARIALARDYGVEMAWQSPSCDSMRIDGNAISIQLKHVSAGGLHTFDVYEVMGFEIAGEDQKFVWAEAKLEGKNIVTVSSPQVPKPVAVRYAWGDNPVVNLQDRNGLPVTPFRTDDWAGVTANNVK
jgi:sialate O-acetylesterase